MLEITQLPAPLLGIGVFVILLAVRCGLLWVTASAVLASLAANDPYGLVARLSYVLGIDFDTQGFGVRLAQVLMGS